MEDTLGENPYEVYSGCCRQVLILVLMEDTLGEERRFADMISSMCLNPCFNGRCSRRFRYHYQTFRAQRVLILVLMEDTLGD